MQKLVKNGKRQAEDFLKASVVFFPLSFGVYRPFSKERFVGCDFLFLYHENPPFRGSIGCRVLGRLLKGTGC